LVISGTFLAVSGGAEISLLSLLRLLQREWDIVVLTCNFRNEERQTRLEEILVISVPYEHLEREGQRLIKILSPQLLYTLMLGSDCGMRLGTEHGIPTVVNICKVPVGPRYLKAHPPTRVLAVSVYVQDYLRSTHGVASTVVNPIIHFTVPPLPPEPRFITIFNPVTVKGGVLFRRLAEHLPEKRFAWVPGWDILRGPTGDFDPIICAAISNSIDIPFTGGTPGQVSMDLPNLLRLEPVFPPHRIYQQTRLLLVPSQWNEAFGRVAVEAMLFGVPVLGSNVGGLTEIVSKGGVALPKDDLMAWVEEIHKLENPGNYGDIQARSEEWRRQWLSRDHEVVFNLFRQFA
jgi:hypothetical protein